ncbi:DUF493 domain-containing protein [Aurantivibrio plasticivorans]
MTQEEPPKIEFPCADYPIKIMGEAHDSLHSVVTTLVDTHAPGFDQTKITVRDSRNGRYQSITVFITATGEDQLKALHRDLMASDLIKMVL